ncbi:hypothetical protein Zmor_011014 [Zophobas morio]|uniref:Reverse transcriptase domain-containing protein n=1 Tax=Zophobas morio TaxID=2755281 RepID=A0AA38MKH6_9CUCU|nr:hypothetical protein Zmor_011014 [Zophobas morio]
MHITARRKLTRELKKKQAGYGSGERKLRNPYNSLKKELSKSIWKFKQDTWNDLCEQLDNDIWGEAYIIVTKKTGIPQMHHGSRYVINFIQSYFEGRKICIDNTELDIRAGVPQGSVLAPLLWFLFYEYLLKLKIPGVIQNTLEYIANN